MRRSVLFNKIFLTLQKYTWTKTNLDTNTCVLIIELNSLPKITHTHIQFSTPNSVFNLMFIVYSRVVISPADAPNPNLNLISSKIHERLTVTRLVD